MNSTSILKPFLPKSLEDRKDSSPSTNQNAFARGIRAPAKLVWRKWITGEEYTRDLTITNIMPYSMRLTYRPPEKINKITITKPASKNGKENVETESISTSVFSTIYPKPILLSAGSTFTIPVSFRPIGYVVCQDSIEFTVSKCNNRNSASVIKHVGAINQSKGDNDQKQQDEFKFKVDLKAVLPEAKLRVKKRVNIDPCAVLDCGIASFQVTNPSVDTTICVNFDIGMPFSIEKDEITLKPKVSQMVKVKFQPKRAGVFRANIKCHFYDKEASDTSTNRNIFTKRIHVTSCAKYPHISCNSIVDFGKVPLGKTKTKVVTIQNFGKIPTPIEIKPIILDEWQNAYAPFSISQTNMVLAAYGSEDKMDNCKVYITYTPHQSEKETVRLFNILACGALSSCKVKCKGTIQRPNVVSIINNDENINTLNFGMTEVGHSYKLKLTLYNKSDAAAYYTLSGLETTHNDTNYNSQNSNNSLGNVFQVGKIPNDTGDLDEDSGASGVLKGKTQNRLIINFTPQFPMAYYRKIALLVHQQEPQFIVLMGTARSLNSQPAVLTENHIKNTRINEINGIVGYPASDLVDKIGNGSLSQDKNNGGLLLQKQTALNSLDQNLSPYTSAFDELFDDGTIDSLSYLPPALQFDRLSVDFGKCEINKTYSETITLTNNTHGHVTVVWSKSALFQLDPNISEIPPKSASRFRIICKIALQDKFFGDNLECFGCYTEQLDYRKVQQRKLIQPSWNADLTVTANTFTQKPYSATVRFSERIINVPALSPGRASYGTFILENHDTSTPVLYHLRLGEQSVKSGVCIVKPLTALVSSSYEVVAIRLKCSPTMQNNQQTIPQLPPSISPLNDSNAKTENTNQYSTLTKVTVLTKQDERETGTLTKNDLTQSQNNSKQNITPFNNKIVASSAIQLMSDLKFTFNASNQFHTLQVQGFAAWPLVSVPNNIYFRPTCVDTSSERIDTIQNISPLFIDFNWITCNIEDDQIIEISPKCGRIGPGDSCDFKICFSPKLPGKFTSKVKLFISCENTNNQSLFLTCHGVASIGRLSVPNCKINLGSVIINRAIEYTLPLVNRVECDVPWRIWLREENDKDCLIEVTPSTGVLPAKAKTDVSITITPREEGPLKFSCISSCAMNIRENIGISKLKRRQLKEKQMDNIDNPLDSSSLQNLCHMKMLAVYPIIKIVSVSGYGLSETISSQHLERWLNVKQFNETLLKKRGKSTLPATEQELLELKSDIEMSLGAAPTSANDNMCINIEFENTSSVVATLKLQLPKDLRIKTPHWANADILPRGINMKYLKVEESKVFHFTPKAAVLNPGETTTVSITFDPTKISGKNIQRFILSLDGGPCIIADLNGISVPENENYIHTMKIYNFDDTPINSSDQQTQYLPLYNGSDKAVKYNIDVGDETAEEFGVNILSCLEFENVIEPGKFKLVPFAFKPLEVREYAMDVFLTTLESENTKSITLIGKGTLCEDKTNCLITTPLKNYTKLKSNPSIKNSIKITMELSESLINFGKIPLFSRVTKTLFIKNTTNEPVLWSFNNTNNKTLEISPNHGRLTSNQYATILLIYNSLPPEKVFYDDLTCSVVLENENVNYLNKLSNFKDMKSKAESEFTIKEEIPLENVYKNLKPKSPKFGNVNSNKAFIRNESDINLNSRSSRYRKSVKTADLGLVEPGRPEVLLLHITLTGASERCFKSHNKMTFFNIKNENNNSNIVSDSNIYDGEPEIIEDLCGDLIHDIIHSSDLLSKIEILDKVEPPKYAQLTDKQVGNSSERELTEPNLFKTILRQDKNVISEKSIPDIPALKMATELLENTFKNIISDAVHKEFFVTEPHRFIVPKE